MTGTGDLQVNPPTDTHQVMCNIAKQPYFSLRSSLDTPIPDGTWGIAHSQLPGLASEELFTLVVKRTLVSVLTWKDCNSLDFTQRQPHWKLA